MTALFPSSLVFSSLVLNLVVFALPLLFPSFFSAFFNNRIVDVIVFYDSPYKRIRLVRVRDKIRIQGRGDMGNGNVTQTEDIIKILHCIFNHLTKNFNSEQPVTITQSILRDNY